ncbi:MAG: hypothetical protein ACYC3I_23295 [Gemmataceae bacterium]
MIVNAYAVLDAFVSFLRLGLGLLVVGLGLFAWRFWRRHAFQAEDREKLENRCHLLLLLASILLWLNVASWPIFYLLLQSYVPQWPDVMCIYGVTRIGSRGIGSSRFLPPLVTALQALKPALVFLSGAWLILHLVNRRTRTAPLLGRVLLLLSAAGLLAVADAAAETAYLLIPKKEVFLSAGCCTGVLDDEAAVSRFLPASWIGEREAPWLYAAYYAVNLGMVLALAAFVRFGRHRPWHGGLLVLLLAALLSFAVSSVFLIETAAPRLIHMPNHHCLYDLVPRAPQSLVAVILFVLASLAVGWACVAAWLGGGPEARAFVPETIGRLLYLSCLAYLGSAIILSVELALAG